jgi:hypothetical protein
MDQECCTTDEEEKSDDKFTHFINSKTFIKKHQNHLKSHIPTEIPDYY